MANRVEITEDVDIFIGRGLMSFKEGWKGPVKAEVYQKLMDRKAARDSTAKAEDAGESASADSAEAEQSEDDTKEKKRGLWPSS